MKRIFVKKVIDANLLPFSKKEYSQFKHGSRYIALKYGRELAHKLVHSFLKDYKYDHLIYVSGAPYNQVPVASNTLCNYVMLGLREIGYTNIKEFKISRQHSYHEDYGSKTAEERKASITGETFYTDRDILLNETVIFIDDILITGAHESRIVDMIQRYEVEMKDFCFAYYAYLEPDACPPDIESSLNGAAVKTANDLIDMFSKVDLLLNTRATKLLLRTEPNTFSIIIQRMQPYIAEDLYRHALGNSYDSHEYYSHNFNILKNYLHGLN